MSTEFNMKIYEPE